MDICKKLLSARFWLALMFGSTACGLAIMKILPGEAFAAMAGMVVAHYFSKTRVGENPLK